MSRAYWDQIIPGGVPAMTGAAAVMDCADLRDAWRGLGLPWPLTGHTLDVGCGTGRLAAHCERWTGVDLSLRAVEYCRKNGLPAVMPIDGPEDLRVVIAPGAVFRRVVCLSVFTHIPRAERQAYLQVFRELSHWLVVDILPGAEYGGVAATYADPSLFQRDFADVGWARTTTYDRVSPDGVTHRYFALEGA